MTPDQIASAPADQQREVLEALWLADRCEPLDWFTSVAGDAAAVQFLAMLDCGAYVDAALMLLPEGMFWSASTEEPGPWAWVGQPGGDNAVYMGETTALALARAIAKAGEA
jgi:hypothetical protein